MTTQTRSVRILSGAVDKVDGMVVLRGVISPASLVNLKTDTYQREAMPLSSQSSILSALGKGERLPDIELGMRGARYREDKQDGSILLLDDIYIIDGLQRVSGSVHFLAGNPTANIRIGATIYFNTDKEWERERFRVLNTARLKVSPSILLRNLRETSPGTLLLYGLSKNEKAFPLYERVSWSQRMTRGELITALTFAKSAIFLHAHKGPTRASNVTDIAAYMDRYVKSVGLQNVRENIRTFYELVDECWGIKRVQYRESAVYMRGQFLHVLAKLLSDHHDFWQEPDEKRLFIYAPIKRKLAQFPITDPTVMSLASSAGKSREMLYMLLRDHINKGKTTKRLTSRIPDGAVIVSDDNNESEAA